MPKEYSVILDAIHNLYKTCNFIILGGQYQAQFYGCSVPRDRGYSRRLAHHTMPLVVSPSLLEAAGHSNAVGVVMSGCQSCADSHLDSRADLFQIS